MSITGAAILLVTIWFLTLFITLQVTAHTQGDAGVVVPGTQEGAPHDFRVMRTLGITTLIAVPLWGAVAAVILWGGITVDMLDIHHFLTERTPN